MPDSSGMERHTYQVHGITLGVWETGPKDGTLLVFLHGFPETGQAWKAQADFFAARGYRVLAPDQRGYNGSSKPKGIQAYRIKCLVQDIVALITSLTPRKVAVVGHDWGGAVAWYLAMRFPYLLHHLVILNMPHPEVMRQTLQRSNRQKQKSSYAAFFQLPLLPEWLCRAFNFRLLEHTLVRTSLPNTFSPQLLEHYKEAWRQPGALTAMLNWYRAYRFFKQRNTEPIAVPILIIWGKKDAFLSASMAAQSAAMCGQARLVMLDNATHWLHHEHPQKVSALIAGFLEGH